MKATINAVRFKNMMGSIAGLLEELHFSFSPTGIHVRQLEPSHLAMVDLDLQPAGFDNYSCPEEEKATMYLSGPITNFLSGRIARSERLSLDFHPEDRSFRMALLDGGKSINFHTSEEENRELISVPKVSFDAVVMIPTKTLAEYLQDVERVRSKNVELTATSNTLTIRGKSDSQTFEAKYHSQGIKAASESKSTYNLKFLVEIVKGVKPVSDVVGLFFSTDYVLKVDIPVDNGTFRYFLAPRIAPETEQRNNP